MAADPDGDVTPGPSVDAGDATPIIDGADSDAAPVIEDPAPASPMAVADVGGVEADFSHRANNHN